MLQLILLLIIVFLGIGWFWGYRYSLKKNLNSSPPALTQYFLGVNYLLNEQPDQAVDAFLKALEVNVSTAEIYLALGNLFRKQGKLERAIRVHQTLFNYPHLGTTLLGQAHLELAEDYLASGIFNQAEQQLSILLSLKYQEKQTLELLLKLYQIQQEWEKSIQIVLQLIKQFGEDKSLVLEHCYCELAEQAFNKALWDEGLNWLKQVPKAKLSSVRSNYLLACLWLKKAEQNKALKILASGFKKSSSYWDEVFPELLNHFWQAGCLDSLVDLCRQQDLKIVGLGLIESLLLLQSKAEAEDFLAQILMMPQSLVNLKKILRLAVRYTIDLKRYWPAIETQFLYWTPQTEEYCCQICGFSSRSFYWCCPGCHHWESIHCKVIN